MAVIVRAAAVEDAQAAAGVLRRSISQLCVADHRNEPEVLTPWLANKTPESVAAWITSGRNYCIVALRDGVLCGMAAMTLAGEINLCYVDPAARFQGLSDAMLKALEAHARSLKLSRVYLNATTTATRFYQARGYVRIAGPAKGFAGMSCAAMEKALAT
jgi:GNAT superfamily N-acetyltransferase